jgi:hypothetical protein
MTFDSFKREILSESLVCGSAADSMTVAVESKKTTKLIAAAALVVHDKGPQWAIDNPDEFQDSMFKYLGWAVRVALMFVPGGVFVTLARILVPVIIEVLRRQFSSMSATAVAVDFDCMATEARRILKG